MTDSDRTAYYHRATSWALDEQASTFGSLRRTRLILIVVVVIAVLEAFALIMLTPLKTVSMVPVLVDRQTGYVERLNPDGVQELKANDALTQSLLTQYVVGRESYDVNEVAGEYHKVALWSAGAARRDYLALMPASNPESPLRHYPRNTLVRTYIKSVSPLGGHTALVRFETRRQDQNGQTSLPQEWAAVLGYRFSMGDLAAADRWLNPLGFQVTSYRKDAEAPLPAEPPEEVQAAPAPPAGMVSRPRAPAELAAPPYSTTTAPLTLPPAGLNATRSVLPPGGPTPSILPRPR